MLDEQGGHFSAESFRASWSENLSDVSSFLVVDTGSNCMTAVFSLGVVQYWGFMEFGFPVLWSCSPLHKSVFLSCHFYREYEARLERYSERIWTCKSTGSSQLTHKEAWEEEQEVAEL